MLYRVCSISIGAGSKNQNLLQVSLQLCNILQNTFLLHRYTYSSAHLPLIESPLEVGFWNTVESFCHRCLNRLDGVEPMSFELPFHSWKLEKVRWSPKLLLLWPLSIGSSGVRRPSLNILCYSKLLCGLRHHLNLCNEFKRVARWCAPW